MHKRFRAPAGLQAQVMDSVLLLGEGTGTPPRMLEAFYNYDAMIKVPLLCNKCMFDAHYLMHR